MEASGRTLLLDDVVRHSDHPLAILNGRRPRAVVTVDRWWLSGLEMLALGVAVALAAYGSGACAAWLLGGA